MCESSHCALAAALVCGFAAAAGASAEALTLAAIAIANAIIPSRIFDLRTELLLLSVLRRAAAK